MNRMIHAGLGGRRGKEVGGLRFRTTWGIIEAADKGYQLKIED